MRAPIATLLIVALLAAGCTPSANAPIYPPTENAPFTAPVVTLTSPVKTLVGLTSTVKVGLLGKTPVYPLFELPNVATNYGNLGIVYWGTRDPNGEIDDVAQAQVLGINGTESQHIWFYNNRPYLVRDDASGYSIVMANRNSQTVVTLCDGPNNAIAHVTMFSYGSTPQLGPVSDGGSCQVFNAVGPGARAGAHAAESLLKQVSGIQAQIDATPYIAGLGFAMAAILKFKQHKDNPTISGAITLMFVAVALIFIPSILKSIGGTTFDSNPSEIDGIAPFYANQPS
jgi:intracellular multiplication protein IcmD